MAKQTEFPEDENEFIQPNTDEFIHDGDDEEEVLMEAVASYVPLPVGKYPAVVTKYKLTESATDNSPQVMLTFSVTDGEFKGKPTNVWYPRDGKRLIFTMIAWEALGIPQTEDGSQYRLRESFFVGKPCYIQVKQNNYMKEGKKVENTQVWRVLPADEDAIELAANMTES